MNFYYVYRIIMIMGAKQTWKVGVQRKFETYLVKIMFFGKKKISETSDYETPRPKKLQVRLNP